VGVQRRVRVPTPVILATIAAVLVGAMVLLSTPQVAQSTRVDRCQRFANESKDRSRMPTGKGSNVVVIGDSYSVGLGLDKPATAWPDRLPGRVHVFGFSGSGFSRYASKCGPVAYYERAAAAMSSNPALVVVEGGLNDVGQSSRAIRYGFRQLLKVVGKHRVLVVGPAPAPLREHGAVRVDRLLSKLARQSGTQYLSMIHDRFTYLDDDLHLTEKGHREFGSLVAAALKAGPQRLRSR
jgi:acyl-CoA thioesterase-1